MLDFSAVISADFLSGNLPLNIDYIQIPHRNIRDDKIKD